MKRFKINIQYIGRNYCGWQRQPNQITIQQVMEQALKEGLKEDIELFSSGRTDSGVNAICAVAHFDSETNISEKKIPIILNNLLPDDIKVLSCEIVPNDFHARFSVKKKTYVYNFYFSETKLPLLDEYALYLNKEPDIKLMETACKIIRGTHDFKGFMTSSAKVKDTVRTIYSAKIIRENNAIKFEICGNGFLYNMVRILAGTLMEIGLKQRSIQSLLEIFETKDRTKAGKLVKANALFLKSVEY